MNSSNSFSIKGTVDSINTIDITTKDGKPFMVTDVIVNVGAVKQTSVNKFIKETTLALKFFGPMSSQAEKMLSEGELYFFEGYLKGRQVNRKAGGKFVNIDLVCLSFDLFDNSI